VRVETAETRGNAGVCVEAHDLAAINLFAFRDKARDFGRVLLAEKLIGPRKLIARLRLLPVEEASRLRLVDGLT
jgi:hypothetical protein